MRLDYAKLVVGQEVAVSRCGSWHTHNEGVYTVVKANKLKVVLQRVSDGITREFSVKRGVELGKGDSRWSSSFIETVADMQHREAQYAEERERRRTWEEAAQAVRNKDLTLLKDIVAKLSQVAV
jgi:hypothetical protein